MTTDFHNNDVHPGSKPNPGHGGHSGHSWMMIVCCIPMVVIAVVLVSIGVVSPGFLFFAVGCTAMMALMMRGMDHGGKADGSTHDGHRRDIR